LISQLWRLYRSRYGPGLDGTGGLMASGRWHARGEPVVYFGGSAAIVVLERLAHIDPDLLPDDLEIACFEVSEAIAEIKAEEIAPLPVAWIQDETVTRRIGSLWRKQGASCLLTVPSAILPEESNFLLNPQHPDAARLRLVRSRRFHFDPRLI